MMEDHRVHKLGHRAFFLFLSRRIKFAVFLFVLTGAVWYADRRLLQGEWSFWAGYAAEVLLLISIAYLLMVLLRTYVEYRCYTYTFTEEAFVVTNGYVTHREVAALYHQIQNVNIERGPFDRVIGVSGIVIILSGAQHDAAHNKIVLPAVGKTKAKLVQKELLVRARRNVS
ncbi:MAG: PH domain-containing protein [Candidatus Pacebacteria bacterium]|nr:PH domain-containing protein [Candidatus Paceibacterota bacterium]